MSESEVLNLDSLIAGGKVDIKKRRDRTVGFTNDDMLSEIYDEIRAQYSFESYIDDVSKTSKLPRNVLSQRYKKDYDKLVRRSIEPNFGYTPNPLAPTRFNAVNEFNSGTPNTLSDDFAYMNGRVVPKLPEGILYRERKRDVFKFDPKRVLQIPITDMDKAVLVTKANEAKGTTEAQARQQLVNIYSSNLSRNFAYDERSGWFVADAFGEIKIKATLEYETFFRYKPYRPLCRMIFNELIKGNGDIGMMCPFAPIYPAFIMIDKMYNKLPDRRRIKIRDDTELTKNLVEEPFSGMTSLVEFDNSIETRNMSTVFYDMSNMSKDSSFKQIIDQSPTKDGMRSKILIVVTPYDMGTDVKTFYKAMGGRIFNFIFAPYDSEFKLYNEAINGQNSNIIIINDPKSPDENAVDGADAEAVARAAEEAEREKERIRLEEEADRELQEFNEGGDEDEDDEDEDEDDDDDEDDDLVFEDERPARTDQANERADARAAIRQAEADAQAVTRAREAAARAREAAVVDDLVIDAPAGDDFVVDDVVVDAPAVDAPAVDAPDADEADADDLEIQVREAERIAKEARDKAIYSNTWVTFVTLTMGEYLRFFWNIDINRGDSDEKEYRESIVQVFERHYDIGYFNYKVDGDKLRLRKVSKVTYTKKSKSNFFKLESSSWRSVGEDPYKTGTDITKLGVYIPLTQNFVDRVKNKVRLNYLLNNTERVNLAAVPYETVVELFDNLAIAYYGPEKLDANVVVNAIADHIILDTNGKFQDLNIRDNWVEFRRSADKATVNSLLGGVPMKNMVGNLDFGVRIGETFDYKGSGFRKPLFRDSHGKIKPLEEVEGSGFRKPFFGDARDHFDPNVTSTRIIKPMVRGRPMNNPFIYQQEKKDDKVHNNNFGHLQGGKITDIERRFNPTSIVKLGRGRILSDYSNFVYKITM